MERLINYNICFIFMGVYFYSLGFGNQYSLLLFIDDYISRNFGGYIANKKYHGLY